MVHLQPGIYWWLRALVRPYTRGIRPYTRRYTAVYFGVYCRILIVFVINLNALRLLVCYNFTVSFRSGPVRWVAIAEHH